MSYENAEQFIASVQNREIDDYKKEIIDKDPIKTLYNLVAFLYTHCDDNCNNEDDPFPYDSAVKITAAEIIKEYHFDIDL